MSHDNRPVNWEWAAEALQKVSPKEVMELWFTNFPLNNKNYCNCGQYAWEYCLSEEERATKGRNTGGGLKVLTEAEEIEVNGIIQTEVFDRHLQLSSDLLAEIVQKFVQNSGCHSKHHYVFSVNWCDRYCKRHNIIDRRKSFGPKLMKQTSSKPAWMLILSETGRQKVKQHGLIFEPFYVRTAEPTQLNKNKCARETAVIVGHKRKIDSCSSSPKSVPSEDEQSAKSRIQMASLYNVMLPLIALDLQALSDSMSDGAASKGDTVLVNKKNPLCVSGQLFDTASTCTMKEDGKGSKVGSSCLLETATAEISMVIECDQISFATSAGGFDTNDCENEKAEGRVFEKQVVDECVTSNSVKSSVMSYCESFLNSSWFMKKFV